MDIRHLAHAWEERFEEAIEEVLSKEGAKIDELIDAIWNKGILDRLVPFDALEHLARRADGRDTFDSRDNPELYWRIIYSVLYAKRALDLQHSMVTHGVAAGALVRGYTLACMRQKLRELCPDVFKKNNEKSYRRTLDFFVQKIIERAKARLRELGAEPHEQCIAVNSCGVFDGILVYVEGYTADGLLLLKPKDHQNILLLYDKMRVLGDKLGLGISPSKLNSADFH